MALPAEKRLPGWQGPISFLLGLLDRAYVWLQRRGQDPSHRFFPRGFGDLDLLEKASEWSRESCRDPSVGADFKPQHVKEAEWDSSFWGQFLLEHYRFVSPFADFLPPESTEGRAQVLLPASGSPIGVAVHLAATGDQGFSFRKVLVARALARAGIASVLIEVPTYGRRRVPGQVRHYPVDVSTYLRTCMGCMWEGRVWARWALRRWNVPCVLTGISWGGAMASGALALSLAAQRDAPATEPQPPLTLVSHLGCDGPVVLMVGAMRDEIDWTALDADLARVAAGHPEWEGLNSSDVLPRLFEEGDLSRLVPGGAVMEGLLVHTVSAAHDSFVPPVYGRRLETSLAASLGATVAAAWVPGGHASAILLAHFFAVPRIVAAVRQLAAVGPSSPPRRARL